MPFLILKADNLRYTIFRFKSDLTIGRHPQSNIALKGSSKSMISRCHAAIEKDDQGFVLFDSSLNGTRVQNKNIESHRLRDCDQFQIANFTLTFVEDATVESISESHPAQSQGRIAKAGLANAEEINDCECILDETPEKQLQTELEAEGIVIADKRMLNILRDVRTVSNIKVPVLIQGEPGTGKAKVARALHKFSRAPGAFVTVNCADIPENQFESELFGSVKNTQSNAETKPGKLELANHGTLFIDEIGDVGVDCQKKLLHFLESGTMSRLGESRIRKLDLRIVAATHRDLNKMTAAQALREDLARRLVCIKLKIPPLRERKKDILALANFFLDKYARQYELDILKISRSAMLILLSYHWPGNVRELADIMLNIYVVANGDTIEPEDLTSASEEIEDYICATSN